MLSPSLLSDTRRKSSSPRGASPRVRGARTASSSLKSSQLLSTPLDGQWPDRSVQMDGICAADNSFSSDEPITASASTASSSYPPVSTGGSISRPLPISLNAIGTTFHSFPTTLAASDSTSQSLPALRHPDEMRLLMLRSKTTPSSPDGLPKVAVFPIEQTAVAHDAVTGRPPLISAAASPSPSQSAGLQTPISESGSPDFEAPEAEGEDMSKSYSSQITQSPADVVDLSSDTGFVSRSPGHGRTLSAPSPPKGEKKRPKHRHKEEIQPVFPMTSAAVTKQIRKATGWTRTAVRALAIHVINVLNAVSGTC